MTSQRRRAANRANAKRSTGPKTATGKAVSSLNAQRHGLAARRGVDAELAGRIEQLVHALAGPEASVARLFHARIAAEATLDLVAIRLLRVRLVETAPKHVVVEAELSAQERQMLAQSPGPVGANPAVLAWAFARAMPSLVKVERYERRTWSRRKTALRLMEKSDIGSRSATESVKSC